MKRRTFIETLPLGLLGAACSGDNPERLTKKPDYRTVAFVGETSADARLMESEQDTFHPDSSIESIRKRTLTDFGRLKVTPPVVTNDLDSLHRTFNRPEWVKYGLETMGLAPIHSPEQPFDCENDISVLRRLKSAHGLDTVVGTTGSELGKLTAVMKYTREFLRGGVEPPADIRWSHGPSAEVITEYRRTRGIGGGPEQYAALFGQLVQSLGFTARVVGMHTVDNEKGILRHSVCEVYMPVHDKWVAFDPFTKATYYERENIPLSCLELRELMLNRQYRFITPRSEDIDINRLTSVREDILPRYRYLYYWRMNDFLTRQRRDRDFTWHVPYRYHLAWEDHLAPLSDGAFDSLDMFADTGNRSYPLDGVRYVSHSRDNYNFTLYHCIANVERYEEYRMRLYIDAVVPNFSHFIINGLDGGKTLQTGKNILESVIYGGFDVNFTDVFGNSYQGIIIDIAS